MKVRELIKLLDGIDPETEIGIEYEEGPQDESWTSWDGFLKIEEYDSFDVDNGKLIIKGRW